MIALFAVAVAGVELSKLLERIDDADDSQETSFYEVKIKISDVDNAGTTSPMFLQIIGEKGATRLKRLNADTENLFERNTENKFTISAAEVGRVNKKLINCLVVGLLRSLGLSPLFRKSSLQQQK
jgi:uncharacterized Fe-S center protein